MRMFCRYDYVSKMINTKIQSILPEMRQLTDRTAVPVKAFDIAMLHLPTSWRASYTKKVQRRRLYCYMEDPLSYSNFQYPAKSFTVFQGA